MKGLSVVFVSILAFFTLAPSVSASSANETYDLHPTINTEVVFEDAGLVLNGEEMTFTVSQKFDVEERVSSEYDIEVDLDSLTYTVTETKVPSAENVLSLASTVKYLFVGVKTLDPIGWKLNHTEGKLWWNTGSSATKVAGNKICTPSKSPTTWYNGSCVTNTDGSKDGGRTYAYGVSAGYYNFDFLSSNKRTDVNHQVYLEGYSGGTSWYRATWNKSGEASHLLHFTTAVSKN